MAAARTAVSDDEAVKTLVWQVGQLMACGFTLKQSEALLEKCGTWHTAANLVAAGCSKKLVLRILL